MAKVTGGEKASAAIKALAAKLKSSKVKVGFLENATYPGGKINVPTVAAIQNFGAPKVGIPPRPFFSGMIAQKKPGWPKAMRVSLKANDYNVAITLKQTGEGIAGQLRQSIIDTYEPALSPVTVMLRGMKGNDSSLVVTWTTVQEARQRVADGKTNYGASTKPLVDSGHLLNSVDYSVET